MSNIKISQLEINPDNPRLIGEEELKKLIKSIELFPEMMKLRPIIVVPSKEKDEFTIIGGTMRYRALQALDYEEIPQDWIKIAKDLSQDQIREFIIKDNIPAGDWDINIINSSWGDIDLEEWGLNVEFIDSYCLSKENNGESQDENLMDFETEKSLGKTNQQGKFLTFGTKKIKLADDEFEMIGLKLEEYLKLYGSTFGFVRWLCG